VNIGKPKRVIEIEPVSTPVPEVLPDPTPERDPEPEPAPAPAEPGREALPGVEHGA
jgi:fused signal recognition particle receptor